MLSLAKKASGSEEGRKEEGGRREGRPRRKEEEGGEGVGDICRHYVAVMAGLA
jgi:hypothetical protein